MGSACMHASSNHCEGLREQRDFACHYGLPVHCIAGRGWRPYLSSRRWELDGKADRHQIVHVASIKIRRLILHNCAFESSCACPPSMVQYCAVLPTMLDGQLATLQNTSLLGGLSRDPDFTPGFLNEECRTWMRESFMKYRATWLWGHGNRKQIRACAFIHTSLYLERVCIREGH